jgi:hypothetical protein
MSCGIMVLQLYPIWQLVQILGKYIIIFEVTLIYLNDLKLGIQKYYLLLQLITIQSLMMMMWHAMC